MRDSPAKVDRVKSILNRIFVGGVIVTMLLTLPTSAVAAPTMVGARQVPGAASPAVVLARESAGQGYVSPTGDLRVLNYFNPPPRPWDAGFHRGIDLAAEPDSLVLAPGAGIVDFVGLVFGKPIVTISHANGLITSLEPVDATVTVGTLVSAGHPIGTLSQWPAETGANATHCPGQSCLHWGVRRAAVGQDDAYLDPLLLLGMASPIVLLPLY